MKSLFGNWNYFRALRLLAGVVLLGYGYSIMDWLIIMIGFTFGLMAITNAGCNPFNRSCDVDYTKDHEH